MLKFHNIIATISLLLAGTGGYFLAYYHHADEPQNNYAKRCTLQTHMRSLWGQQAYWMRNYIMSALQENSDMGAAQERLLKNQKDIGYSFIAYYGKETGRKLAEFLREQALSTIEFIAASKSGNQAKIDTLDEKWHNNARELSIFLSMINPYWEQERLLKMFRAHITLTMEEISARLHKKWKEDIICFDKILDQIVSLADHFSAGIIDEFPEKFA